MDGLVLGFELFVQATAVQIALKLGNVPLFAVVAAHFVEDFNEHGQKRIDLGFADDIGFLVDVEQNALRRNCDSSLQRRPGEFHSHCTWEGTDLVS